MLQQPDIDTYVNVCRTLLILLGKPEVAGAWVATYILCIGYQVRRIGSAAGAQGTQQAAGGAGRRGAGKGGESYQYSNGIQHQNPCFYYPHPPSSDQGGLGRIGDGGDDEMGNSGGRPQHPPSSSGAYLHQTSFREGGSLQQQGDASSACPPMIMANAQSQLRLLTPSSSSLSIQLQQLKAANSA